MIKAIQKDGNVLTLTSRYGKPETINIVVA